MDSLTKLLDLGYSFQVRDGTVKPIFNGGIKPDKAITEPLFEDLKSNKDIVVKFLNFDEDYFLSQIVEMMERLNLLKWRNSNVFNYLKANQGKLYNKINQLEQDIDKYYSIHDGPTLYKTLGEYEGIINDLYKKYGKHEVIKEYVQQDIFSKIA